MQKLRSIKCIAIISALIFTVFSTGCSTLKFPGVYRIAVMQGNIIDQKKVDQLKIGMTKRQVQYVMGTPLVSDVFNENRWDYVYQLRRGGEQLRDKRFTLHFENEVLVSYEGDYEPNAGEEDPEGYIEDAKKT